MVYEFKYSIHLILILISTVSMTLTGVIGGLGAYGQMSSMNNTGMPQHAKHIFDNLIISQHIPLTGQLVSGDYILLMDLTPFATSVEGQSHIALKVPCGKDGSPKVTVIT